MMMVLLIAAGWLACGVVTAGYWYAYFQRQYPDLAAKQERHDWWSAMLTIPIGPCGMVNLCFKDFRAHGWSLNRSHHKLLALDKLVNGGQ